MSYEDVLKSALENAAKRERIARQRSIIYTSIPVIMAVILIGVTWWQVSQAEDQLSAANNAADTANSTAVAASNQANEAYLQVKNFNVTAQTYQDDIKELQATREALATENSDLIGQKSALQNESAALQTQVADLENLVSFLYKGERLWEILKEMASDPRYYAQANVLSEILDQAIGGAKWENGGLGPDGYDSPGFAVMVLSKFGLVQGDPVQIHYDLRNTLRPVDQPNSGDVIFYNGGYTMFYFEYREEQFVIGMTPLGIVALRYDFAPIVAIGHVNYP